jgi:hypothetical protein
MTCAMLKRRAAVTGRARAALLLVILAGCGGSSTPAVVPPVIPPVATTVVGTAATGLPVASATVVLKDRTGAQVTGTTSASGQYTLSTTGLTPPFLVKVTSGATTPGYPAGTVFFSVSADAAPGVLNVTPLTDLVVRSWYRLQPAPVTAEVAFANPVANPPPLPGVVTIIENVIRQVVGNLLSSKGVDPATLNLISTPFLANGAGVDGALDLSRVDAAGGTVVVGTVTTTVAATGGVISTTAVSGSASTSTSVPVPTNAQAPAVTGIQAAADAFAAVVNAKGTQLADTDVLPHLDAGAMMGGSPRAQTAAVFASVMRAQAAGDAVSMKVVSLDRLAGSVAHVTMLFTRITSGGRGSEFVPFAFVQQAGGAWLSAGDLKIAQVGASVQTGARNGQAPFTGLSGHVNMLVTGQGGTALSGPPSVRGPGLASTLLIPSGVRITQVVAQPGAAATNMMHDTYRMPQGVPAAAGDVFTVSLPTAAGPVVSYDFTMRASTNETIAITNLVQGLANAQLGSPLPVTWTLPTTFTVTGVQLDPQVYGDTATCVPPGFPQLLPSTATSGTVTLPATCAGGNVTGALVSVKAYGANGEVTSSTFQF